jgi:glycosyltransferase involved in cell wall biosynthesis
MKLLIIGTDRNLFDPESAVRARAVRYSTLVDEMHIIVYTLRRAHHESERIAENVYIHPTASWSKLLYLPDAWVLGRSILRGNSSDWVVSVQDPFESGLAGYALSLTESAPFHVQLHTDLFSPEWRSASLLNAIRYVIGLFLLRAADGIRVVSERVKKGVRLLGVSDDRITVVPIYVETGGVAERTDLTRSYPGYGKFVLSVGRFEWEKNFPSLLRAFKDVRKSHQDALLIIIGTGREHQRLTSIAEWLGVDEHVRFLPWSHDVSVYLRGAHCYVQPSLYEGWGMAVIEALAAGTPVVMTDVGCAGEVVKDGSSGLVVPVNDHVALGDAVSRVLGDHGLAERLRAGAYESLEKLPDLSRSLELYKESWENAMRQAGVKS